MDSQPGGIDTSESTSGLHKRLQIRAQTMLIVASYSRTLSYVVVVIFRFHFVQMIKSEAEAMIGMNAVYRTVSCHSFRKLHSAREMLLRIDSLCTRKKVK